MLKRMVPVVALLVASLFVGGCKKKGPQTLRDEAAGMQIVVPPGFKVGPLSKDEASVMHLQAGDYTKDIGAGVVSEAKADLADIATLEAYMEVSGQNRRNVLKNMVEGPRTSKRCGVHRCVQEEIRGASNGLNLVYLVLFVETGTHFHQVQAWTSPSKLEGNRATMQSVLDSYADIPR